MDVQDKSYQASEEKARAPRFSIPKANEGRPFLTLVEREYLKSMGNIPPAAWEPLSYLYSEADQALLRIQSMPKGDYEEVRQITIGKWCRVISWLDNLLTESGSVKALRSWQMVQSFQASHETQSNVLATVSPQVQGQDGKRGTRFGLRRR